MATRAEWFRYNTERSGPKKTKSNNRKPPRDARTEPRNESVHGDKRATYALEDFPGGRPSRLSTRKSSNRMKTDVQFRIKHRTQESRQGERPRTGGR